MSYIRWSSDIKNVMSSEEEMNLYREGKKYEDILAIEEARGAVRSDWYIYWHANGLEKDAGRYNQLLSIWHKTMGDHLDTFSYGEVKDMHFRDDWSAIHCTELTQKEVMKECVERWLKEVEDEYSS